MKHNIDVEGLPEGWKPVEVLIDPDNKYMGDDGHRYCYAKIKLGKIKPRRIVLEETDEDNTVLKTVYGEPVYVDQEFENLILLDEPKIWREVKEE